MADMDRFWSKVDRHSDDECWRWTASLRNGYGQIWVDNHIEYAHRLSYLVHVGAIEDGLYVCHSCDDRLCVNPAHLFLGTAGDNHADCIDKGRDSPPPVRSGEANGFAKISDEVVATIRSRYAAGGVKQQDLATEFGISQAHVSDIVLNKRRAITT